MVARRVQSFIDKLQRKFKRNGGWPSLVPVHERPAGPREVFGGVFDVVQLSRAFKDSKTFVDCVPKRRPRSIIRSYFKRYGAQLDISRFVRDHFILPPPDPEPEMVQDEHTLAPIEVRAYIERMWKVLTREADKSHRYSTLLELPYRYVVPGGRFREVYYWDSYFTMLGLREAGEHELLEEMVRNFAYLIARYGFIPNANRTYYLSRSQPPVFALMVELLADVKGEQVLVEFGSLVEAEYKYWMRGEQATPFQKKRINKRGHVVRMPDGELLNRYFDTSISPREEGFREDLEIGRHMDESASFYRSIRAGAESGWDFSSRWLSDGKSLATIRTTDIVPVDLNVLLYMSESLLTRIYQKENKPAQTKRMVARAERRREAIQKYLWHEEHGWYYDWVHSEEKQNVDAPSIAAIFPLFGGVASAEQAARVSERVEREFMRPGGVATTLVETGQQWDEPNGWAPLQYISVMGLERYGMHDLAREIAIRWCALNISVYERTGKLLEKYNITDVDSLAGGGEYDLQDGFGWTNGVLITLMNKYHINREIPRDVEVPEVHEIEEPKPAEL